MKEASADAESVIELKNVSIKAGDARILKELDWTVRRGERWAVAGKNGAGKTTLLSLLIGDHPQVFAQHIRLFGHQRGDGQTLWEYKAQIGWAAPDIALHYDTMTTTFQFVCTGFFETLGLYRDCSRAQQRTAREWLEYFGLSGAADVPFRLLSDGQQRLVLLARALVKNPPLLILDEPCQGLDAASRAQVLAALERVCKAQGTTLIIVTHYRDELPACITHSLELKKGQRATVRKVRATR